jgi:hypothetical protein
VSPSNLSKAEAVPWGKAGIRLVDAYVVIKVSFIFQSCGDKTVSSLVNRFPDSHRGSHGWEKSYFRFLLLFLPYLSLLHTGFFTGFLKILFASQKQNEYGEPK